MSSQTDAKKGIQELVRKFEQKSPKDLKDMNEETVKKNFILPLFRYLGWDVDSDEVSAEEKISKKRVDYGFKISGMTKFFLEAKKPSEDVITDADHIRQAINYSYWQSVTWAVLTNFQDLIVFNAEWKGRNLSENRFITLNYKDYVQKFDDLWLLSRENFEKNLIDEKAVTLGKKQKREQIGDKILSDMIEWRSLLTKNINKYDHKLGEETLDEAVQRILDRFIFIKSLEDRGIENIVLLSKARQWQENWQHAKRGLWDELKIVFREFDSKYNSRLFEPHICESLRVDDDVVYKIIIELNSDEAGLVKYDFSAIPADILGNIYEQYLGHILKKSAKSTKVIEKHAHRKEQGIYYTPTYIVDYIVKNTLVEYVKDKNLDDILNVKILDPACGSGSFIIKAYSTLLELVEKRLEKKETSKQWHSFRNYPGRLTLPQKITILTQCIHGVDLDKKAVEIAQLNLLLKLLEGETRETLSNLREVKKLLPMLNDNIKCGNSLIDDERIDKNKAFKWEREFKNTMQSGGFDIVIGNPPYIDSEEMVKTQPKSRQFYTTIYSTAKGNWDIFCIFIEKGLSLLKNGRFFGMIVPNKLLSADYAKEIRKYLQQYEIIAIRDYSRIPVFSASVYPVVVIAKKESPRSNRISAELMEAYGDSAKIASSRKLNQDDLNKSQQNTWSHIFQESGEGIIEKILCKSSILSLSSVADVYGAATVSEAYELKKILKDLSTQKNYIRFINTGTIDRYSSLWGCSKTTYIKSSYTKPIVLLKDLEDFSKKRYNDAKSNKIIIAGMTKKLECYLDNGHFLAGKSTTIVKSDKINLKVLLAILNSKLITFIYKNLFKSLSLQGGYIRVGPPQIKNLPIKKVSDKEEKQIIELVDNISSLNKRLNEIEGKNTDEKKIIEKEIESIDAKIDEIVYDIYGITENEQSIIEANLK